MSEDYERHETRKSEKKVTSSYMRSPQPAFRPALPLCGPGDTILYLVHRWKTDVEYEDKVGLVAELDKPDVVRAWANVC